MLPEEVPTLTQLIDLIRTLTHYPRGTRTKFAKHLGVSPQQLNGWLSRTRHIRREPGGSITLQMLKWAKAREAKQKEGDGRATNTPAASGPNQNIQSNERKNSGRRKT